MTSKDRILATIEAMPDNVSIDEVVERLSFLAAVQDGLQQTDAGQVIEHADIVREFFGTEGQHGQDRLDAS